MRVETEARYDTEAFGSSALILAELKDRNAGAQQVAVLEIVGEATAKAKGYNNAGESVDIEVRLEIPENQ